MNIYKPSELKAFLSEIGAAPKKSLSQNFLIDGNIIKKIVALANIQKEDSVLEIGPGPGALTEALLETGAHVIAVEKDRKFAAALQRLQTHDNRLTIYKDDILSWDMRAPKNTKLIGNLPYAIVSPILGRFLPRKDLFSSLTLMVQKEVAERLTAHKSSSLSLFVQFYSTPVKGFVVQPSCFYPVPKVTSAVLQLIPKDPSTVNPDLFFAMVHKAFQKKRKMIRSSFKGSSFGACRPEELSLDDFLTLFHEMEEHQRKQNS